MLTVCIIFGFLFLLLLPVGYATLVCKRKKGNALYINQEKVHNPRYFGESFAALMQAVEKNPNATEVKLSRMEPLDQIVEGRFEKPQYDNLVYSGNEPLTIIPANMNFRKEIYATDDICLAGDTILRALYTRRNLILGNGTFVGRWADARGTAAAFDDCNLGLSFTSASGLSVGNNCTFRRLYAPEILLGHHPQEAPPQWEELPDAILSLNEKSTKERNIRYVLDDMKDENGVVPYSLITRENLVVTERLVIQGNIRSEKGVHLCEGAVVCGNLFAEGDIVLDQGSCVLGTVFTQGSVLLEDRVTIGRRGRTASLIARDHIYINGRARIFGYVSCEKGGEVNKAVSKDKETGAAFLPSEYRFLFLPQGAVPRLTIAAANGRLAKADWTSAYRFMPPKTLPSEQAEPILKPRKDSLPKPLVQVAALAGICCVCLLAGTIYGILNKEPAEQWETPAVDLYRNQGLTAEMQLETVPIRITEDYVVFHDRVLQRFHVSEEEIAEDAEAYSSILDMVPDGINQYVMLVPLRICYEEEWKAYGGDIEAAAALFASRMPQDVTFIDLLHKLPSGQDQYIFYRTEPYWAAEGAYYGAAAFFAEKGEPFPALTTYRQALYETFEGSLFTLTDQSKGDDATYDDRLYLFMQPEFRNQEILYRRQEDGSYLPSAEPILSKSRTAMSSYIGNSTFSHAILEGSVKNGRTLLLIGDTSAKIMASFFTDAYETVYIINQKWYSQVNSTFSKIFEDYNVTDVLMVESMATLGDELSRARTYRIVTGNVTTR